MGLLAPHSQNPVIAPGVRVIICTYLLYCVYRYMKGIQERGSILGSVDDIVLTLDDNAMNLQSMSASRFIGPFLEKVQKWEKSLSHISEVVEVLFYVYV